MSLWESLWFQSKAEARVFRNRESPIAECVYGLHHVMEQEVQVRLAGHQRCVGACAEHLQASRCADPEIAEAMFENGEAGKLAEGADFLEGQEPADLMLVCEDDVCGLPPNDVQHIELEPGPLVGSNRYTDSRPHARHGVKIVHRYRLLNKLQVEGGKFFDDSNRFGRCPRFVGINSQSGGRAGCLPDCFDHLKIDVFPEADLQVEGRDALGHCFASVSRHAVQVFPGNVVVEWDRPHKRSAEQVAHRLFGSFPDDVPESHLHAGDGTVSYVPVVMPTAPGVQSSC